MLTILEVSNFDRSGDRARGAALVAAGRPDLRWVLIEPDHSSWTEAEDHELIVEHVAAPPLVGGRRRALLRAQALRDLVQLHRPAAIVCGSPLVLPALLHLCARRLSPRPALVGRWRGSAVEPLRRELAGLDARLGSIGARLGPRGARAASWWAAQGLASFDAVFVDSRAMAARLQARGLEHLHVVPTGVELPSIEGPRPALAGDRGASPGARTVIAVATAPTTSMATLTRIRSALCRALPRDPVLVSLGPVSEAFERLAATHEHVHVVSEGGEHGAWLAAAALALVAPGFDDGGRSACARAMAWALPVVVAEREGGAGELILVREADCGVVVAEARPEALVDAALELRRRPELAALGRRGRRSIERFDLDSCAARELACLRELIDHVRGGAPVPTGIHEPLALPELTPE